MLFVKGELLRERLVKGELSVKDTIHVLRDVASALDYAHRESRKRSTAPRNDFGGAGGGLTSLGVALGTPAYMSPGQASADPRVDHRADISGADRATVRGRRPVSPLPCCSRKCGPNPTGGLIAPRSSGARRLLFEPQLRAAGR